MNITFSPTFATALYYLVIGISLFSILVYYTLIAELRSVSKGQGVSALFRREMFEENNTSLGIYVWAKMIAITILLYHSMALSLIWVVLFTLAGYAVQEGTAKVFEKYLKLEWMLEDILDRQNVGLAYLYGATVISLSLLIGRVVLP